MADREDPAITHVFDVSSGVTPRRFNAYRLRLLPDQHIPVEHSTKPVFTVGAHDGNDLVLKDPAVSRIHFEIIVDDGGFRLRDLGSTNGTFVDGFRVFDTFIRPGARIRVGGTQLVFEPLDEQAEQPISSAESFGLLIGRSRVMREIFATLEQVAPSDLTVLIQGESGTGKDLIASSIHEKSTRKGGPFVIFDCSAVPVSLIESELFGHERGAFTGADVRRIGCMAEADKGTLFLDEIGELPLEAQAKLLRAVEKREIRPVGGNKTLQIDVRVIAATNRDLSNEVNRGAFRADLFYRLAVVQLRVPPLRERLDDIPLLVDAILRDSAAPNQLEDILYQFEQDGWRILKSRPWSGNVRELRNVIERAALLGPGDFAATLGLDSKDRPQVDGFEDPTEPALQDDGGYTPLPFMINLSKPMLDQKKEVIAKFEHAYIKALLARSENNLSRAAAHAGVDRSYFKRLIKKYEL